MHNTLFTCYVVWFWSAGITPLNQSICMFFVPFSIISFLWHLKNDLHNAIAFQVLYAICYEKYYYYKQIEMSQSHERSEPFVMLLLLAASN